MRNLLTIFMFVLGLSALPLAATAQEEEESPTMVPTEDGTLPDDVPEDSEAHKASEYGLETANEAREKRREFGEERAAEARENAGDHGADNVPDDLPGGP